MASDVIIDNQESVLDLDGQTVFISGSTLDWYKLTELSRHLLSQAVTGSIQQQLDEMGKPNPDQAKISELEQVASKASKINRDPRNFKSKDKMLDIIKTYSGNAH